MPTGKHVLIVSDEELASQRVRGELRGLGCDVALARSASHGLIIAVTTEPDVVVVDLALPPSEHAFEFAQAVRAKTRAPSRLVAMGHGKPAPIVEKFFDAWLQLPPTTTAALRAALGLA